MRDGGDAPENGFRALDVHFAVEGRNLLEGVSVAFTPGTFTSLIGHNGSGKSTFLKILARQQRETSGSVLFAGRPLRDWGDRAFAQRVAYLPQVLPAATGLTVRELVGFGRYPWRGPFARLTSEDHDAVGRAIARCRLEPMADRIVDTLSGGERQRAWLAMLVAQDADFILLDEPVSALDLAQQMQVLTFLHDLAAREGKGVVAVLHDINMAVRFCDRVVALKRGRVTAEGGPDEIMRADILEGIYDLPMEVATVRPGGRPVALPR